MKFRKKPVVVEATQWFKNDDHPKVIPYTASGDGPYSIHTLEGQMRVMPGDWIITGVKGEHYLCKPDIFALTYEPEDAALAQQRESEPDRVCKEPDGCPTELAVLQRFWRAAQSAEPIDGFGGNLDEAFDVEPVACKGIPRKGCQYLAFADMACNKCGDVHHHHQMLAHFYASPPPTTPDGWMLVPKEPTREMLDALNQYALCAGYVPEGYRAMLAAVKEPK